VARKDPHRLREDAASAVARGKHAVALELYRELEALEPASPTWPKRIGEAHRRLGDNAAAIAAFERAIEKYIEDGLLVQAIGVCKMILSIAPTNVHAATRLAELALGPAPLRTRTTQITLPPGRPIDAVPLASERDISGVTVIPIEIDLDDVDDDPKRAALLATPVFGQLPQPTLERMIERMTLVDLAPGAVLFCEGEPGATMYVVADGEVIVESNAHELARLGPGTFFGEIALVTDLPRSATVRAVGRVELLAIDRDLLSASGVIPALLGFVRARLVDRIARTSELFEPFTDDERRGLAAQFEVIEVDAGTRLITQGTRADGLYIVMAGRAEVTRGGSVVATLLTGDVFGEMSLLAGHGSTADVTAATRLLALRMPVKTFREMIMTYPQVLAYLGELSSKRSLLKQAEDMIDLHIDML
jgi:cAMP-dependent protein kinase regulator